MKLSDFGFLGENLGPAAGLCSIAEGREQIITAIFGGAHWRDIGPKSHLSDRKSLHAAIDQATSVLLESLCNGEVQSWVHIIGRDLHYRLPKDLWFYEDCDGVHFRSELLAGRLIDVPSMEPFALPEKLRNLPIWVRRNDLARLGPIKSAGARTQFDWTAFHEKAVEILRDEGGISAGFLASHLVASMLDWTSRRWPRTPGRTSAFEHVNKAIAIFEAQRVR